MNVTDQLFNVMFMHLCGKVIGSGRRETGKWERGMEGNGKVCDWEWSVEDWKRRSVNYGGNDVLIMLSPGGS